MSQSEPNDNRPGFLSHVLGIEKKPLHFRVIRGAVSSIVRKIIVAPISLLLVPFTLHKVGVAGYGTWAVLSTIINLTWLMDPGLSPTVTKYVAEHSGTDDIPEIRRVLDSSLALCLFMSAIASCVLWAFSRAIIGEFFRGPAAPAFSEIHSLWPLVMLCITVFLLTIPFMAFINGRQRMDLTNLLVFCAELLSVTATVVLLYAGAKVRGLLLAQLLTFSFMLFGSIVIVRRLLPSVTPNPFRCKLGTLRKLIAFSVPLYAGYIMTSIQGQLEKLYLARFVGIVPVGWYNVASEGASKVKRMPDLLLGPVLAAASELDATKERRKVEELHFRAHKYLAFVAVPLTVFAVVTAKQLISLWVGHGLELVALPFALLVIGNFFPQMGSPIYFILVGRGILRPAVYTAALAAVLNVLLSFIFIKRWGFSGAVLGTAFPMILSTVYFFFLSGKYFEAPLYRMLGRAYLKPLFCSLIAALAVLAIGALGMGRVTGLIVETIGYGTIYLTGLVVTRFFDNFDIAAAESHVPFLRITRRIIPVS
jgi:O-antigen/teichoic acid export membrane protein